MNDRAFVATLRRLDRPAGAEPRSVPERPTQGGAGAGEREVYIGRESAIKSAIEMLHQHGAWLESSALDKVKGGRVGARAFEAYITGTEQERTAPDGIDPRWE